MPEAPPAFVRVAVVAELMTTQVVAAHLVPRPGTLAMLRASQGGLW